jgi:RimJ/RimL family protein N-acetyltransferase
MLFHISEEPGIARFEPRPSESAGEPVVWAVDEAKLRNYLLPRDCPRVTFFAGPKTSAADAERFLGASTAVVAFESGWLPRVQATRLYCYHLPDATFECTDRCAGYFVSREAVVPSRVEALDNVLDALTSQGVEVRLLPSLWPLHDAVLASTLSYSIIRMRNAQPRDETHAMQPVMSSAETRNLHGLASERLTYEPLTAAHAAALFPSFCDPRVTEHIGDAPASLEALAADFTRMAAGPPASRPTDQWIDFAVRLASTGDYIGRIESTCYGAWAEVAYVFGVAWWGKGYASEAMRWMHAHLMSRFGVTEFWATVRPANTRSLALLARLGYQAATPDSSRNLRSYDPGDLCFRFRST